MKEKKYTLTLRIDTNEDFDIERRITGEVIRAIHKISVTAYGGSVKVWDVKEI